MKKHRRLLGQGFQYLAIGCGVLELSGCGGETSPVAVSSSDAAIIAGVPVNGALLDSIGSLGTVRVDPHTQESSFSPYCSGSLIGRQTVLTAKHCLQFFTRDQANGDKTAFAIGPDANAPSRLIEVLSAQGAPGDVGGFIGYGRDVGVMYLSEAVTDLTPLTLATLRPGDLGQKFVEIGYGARDNTGASGTRRAGNAKLVATTGKVFELFFGSFAAFESWYTTGSVSTSVAQFTTGPVAPLAFLPIARSLPDLPNSVLPESGSAAAGEGGAASSEPSDPDAYLHHLYDTTLLVDGYEAKFGGTAGDAQACYGDSGSPIVRANGHGALFVYGVVSGGLGSNSLICDYGGIEAVFGPEVLAFLDTAKKWSDPCRGHSLAGTCTGKVAQRCTSPSEGPRRLVKVDCGSIGQVCAIQPDGTAGCSDPPPKKPMHRATHVTR